MGTSKNTITVADKIASIFHSWLSRMSDFQVPMSLGFVNFYYLNYFGSNKGAVDSFYTYFILSHDVACIPYNITITYFFIYNVCNIT